MSRRLTIYLLALGTVALWGASFVLTKLALEELGPQGIAFVRWAISTVALGGWLTMTRRWPIAVQLLRQEGRTVAWIALTGITLFYALENLALRYTTAVNTGILANFTTVFMALLGTFWLGERLRLGGWLAMAVAFVGAVLVSQGSGHLTVSGPGLRGDLLMVIATLFAAIYSVGGKQLVERFPADVVTTLVAALGTLFLLPLALWEGMTLFLASRVVLALSPGTWSALLLLGLGSGALANLWWLHVLAYTQAARAGMILFLIPVFSTALAVTVLHEPLTLTMLVGATLVLGSMAIMQRKRNE
jgi:drug/metabolite transporter (DMT)-like permease